MARRDWMVVLAGTVLAVGLTASPGTAQQPLEAGEGFDRLPRIGIGYVANAPNMFAGAMAFAVFDIAGGLGLYVDGKYRTENPSTRDDYMDSLSVADIELFPGQRELQDGFFAWSVNAALVKTVSPEMMIYAGAGYAVDEQYVRYYDGGDFFDLGVDDRYWVKDEANSGPRVNLLGGVIFRMTRHVALHFGLELVPPGVTVGGSYSFPL